MSPSPRTAGRVGLVLLLALALGGTALALSDQPTRLEGDGHVPVIRFGGVDRYDTARLVATDTTKDAAVFAGGVAVIARGDTFPDALAGSYLAGLFHAPILLTARDRIPDATWSALFALGVEKVFLLGGEAAIPPAIADELAQHFEVERLAGRDRYETAAVVGARRPPATSAGLLFAGDAGFSGSTAGAYAGLTDITTDSEGNLYVADQFNHCVQVLTPTGGYTSEFGTYGSGQGQMEGPVGVAVSPAGEVFVSQFSGSRVEVFTTEGLFLRRFGSSGSDDGQFLSATGIAIAPDGTIWVGDSGNHRIQHWSEDGVYLGSIGSNTEGPGGIQEPRGIDVGPDGRVYVSNRDLNRVDVFEPSGQLVRSFTAGADGTDLAGPYDVSVAPDGTVAVADRDNRRLQLIRADGTPLTALSVAGGSSTTFGPIGVMATADGRYVVADADNDRLVIFEHTPPSECGLLEGLRTAIVVTGERPSDALVVGAAAYRRCFPLLLTTGAVLPDATRSALDTLDIEQVIVLGGAAAVSDDVVAAIQEGNVTVLRIAGPTRVETAVEFARFAMAYLGFRQNHANVASGSSAAFPDTLGLGPHAGEENAPILLTAGAADPGQALLEHLKSAGPCGLRSLHVAGGTVPVPDAIADLLRDAVEYDAGCVGFGPPETTPVDTDEPSSDRGGLSMDVSAPSPPIGSELTITLAHTGGASVQVEVWSEFTGGGLTSRILQTDGRITLNAQGNGQSGYRSAEPRTDLIVACVVPQGQRCTTGDPADPAGIRIRDDVAHMARETVNWNAELTAPLVAVTDPDGSGLAHLSFDNGTFCYGLSQIAGVPMPAGSAGVYPAAGGAAVLVMQAPVEVERDATDQPVGASSGCVSGVDATLENDIRSSPQDYRVRVNSGQNAAIRGTPWQTSHLPTQTTGVARLSGTTISNGVAGGGGFAVVRFSYSYTIVCFDLFVTGGASPGTSVTLRRGGPDGAGPVFATLEPHGADGRISNCLGPDAFSATITSQDRTDLETLRTPFSIVVDTSSGRLSGALTAP